MGGDLNILIALAAGLLSFLSPCVLPLIPSYIGFIGGVTLQDLKEAQPVSRAPVVIRTLFFVLGFSIVFIVLGIVFSGSGFLLGGATQIINYVAGGVVIVLGLNVVFDFWKFLNFERRFHVTSSPRGYLGSGLVGMAFGAGWTPCIGPILAGILFLAGQSGHVARGAVLLGAFSLGLGIPFLLAGYFFPAFLRWLTRIKKYLGTIRVVSGIFLVGVGVLIAMGRLQTLNGTVISAGTALGAWDEANPVRSRLIFGAVTLAVALLPLITAAVRRILGSGAARPGRFGVAFVALFVVVSALQFAGVVNMAEVLKQWLTFQGI